VSSYCSLSITADNDSTAMSFSACRLRGALYPLRPATYARYARPKFLLATLAGFLLTGRSIIGVITICTRYDARYQPPIVGRKTYDDGERKDT